MKKSFLFIDLITLDYVFFPIKLSGKEDDHFRRLLSTEKDVKLIDDVLELVCRDFEHIKEVRKIKLCFYIWFYFY